MTRRVLAGPLRHLLFGLGLAAPLPLLAQDRVAVTIRALVNDGRVPEARWPTFSRYAADVARVYAAGGDDPVWLDGPGRSHLSHKAREAITALRSAKDHGLDPNDYDAATLDSVSRHLTPADRAWVDVLLTVNVMRYLDDLRGGRLHPAPLSRTIPVSAFDLGLAVRDAIAGDSVAKLVAAVTPRFTQYRTVQRVLATYRHRAAAAPGNARLRKRVRQLELALERLRWLPPIGRQPFVVVNIPAFELFGFDSVGGSGAPSLRMKVIVGKAVDTRTPVLLEHLRFIEFRPYWHVPRSILVKDILPLLRRKPTYLRAEAMELVTVDGRVVGQTVDSAMLQQLEQGMLSVRQRPSPRNALGTIKFVFPNAADVYLHGTPQTKLFARSRRDFSHGCIRLEYPAALATWVLRDQAMWTPDRVSAMMTGPTTTRVALARPMPVILFYTTAVVEPDGRVSFYEDIYGHDGRLDRALRAGPRP